MPRCFIYLVCNYLNHFQIIYLKNVYAFSEKNICLSVVYKNEIFVGQICFYNESIVNVSEIENVSFC